MGVFSMANCMQFVALLALLGCQRTGLEPTQREQTKDADGSQAGQRKQGGDTAHPDITRHGVASRRLRLVDPIDDRQAAREPDLTITWYGNPPGDARVFAGSAFVGQGREGFAAAVKAVGALPKRAKLRMSYKAPPVFLSDGRDTSEIPDPFSAWPDLDAAFSKLVSDKEICVQAYKGWDLEGETSRPSEVTQPIDQRRLGTWATLGGDAGHPLKLRGPLDDTQAARKPDVTITWRGYPPSDARVFVGSDLVGRGREGFDAAVKALDELPRRAKLRMSYKAPRAFFSYGYRPGRDTSDVPDPFSAWPDLDATFLKLVSEKEICVQGDIGKDTEEEK